MKKVSIKIYSGLAAMMVSLGVQACDGEGIVLDPATGNYAISYCGENGLTHTTFEPATKTVPTIFSSFHADDKGIVSYRYALSNGSAAKQGIRAFVIEEKNPIVGELPSPVNRTKVTMTAYRAAMKVAMTSPSGWQGHISRDSSQPDDSQVDWSPDVVHDNVIQAGQKLAGFSFGSLELPGVGISRIYGRTTDFFGYPDDGPSEDSPVFAEIDRLRDNDFIRRNAAVPTIAVPVPFDAATLLDRIRTHFLTWQGKQLIEPAFASQLDRYLVAATEAFRRNQIKAGKEHLETIHELLEKEHKHLDGDDDSEAEKQDKEHRTATRPNIDRLAARVLDFDLKYVLKRLEEGKEKAEKK